MGCYRDGCVTASHHTAKCPGGGAGCTGEQVVPHTDQRMRKMPSMFPDRPLVAIIGAGAVGGYYGARLAQHGHDVHFLLRGDYEAVRRGGWIVESCDGDFRVPA